MKKICSTLTVIMAAFICNQMYAAVFSLRYRGYNYARVSVGGSTYELGGHRKDLSIDTGGIYDIDKISWDEGFQDSNYGVTEKTFTLTLPKKIWAWDIGGEFTIFDNGRYSYRFGLSGSHEGKVDQVGPTRKTN